MTLFEVFDRLELTSIGVAIRDSLWLFPVVEAVHLLALAMLGGAVLVVDLRLLGFGMTRRSPAYLLEQSRSWQVGSILLLVATGVPLLLSEAVKLYFSPVFWWKMGFLLAALVFTFGVRNRGVSRQSDLAVWQARAIAMSSIGLWVSVAAAGRWIGFS